MSVATLLSMDEYLRTSFDPDCDYVDGQILERNVGKRRHSYAQARVAAWFINRWNELGLESLTEQRTQVAPGRIRIPDIVVVKAPCPDEEVFMTPPYICVEVMSPEDTFAKLQDRIDDYVNFGVENIWVVDPWKRRAWVVTSTDWQGAVDGVLRTKDGRVAMPLSEVLLP